MKIKNTRKRQKSTLFIAMLLAMLTATIFVASGQEGINIIRERPSDEYLYSQAPPANRMSSSTTPLNCRYGSSVLENRGREWLETLSSGWFLDFSASNTSTTNSEYMRQVRVRQDRIDVNATTYDPSNYLPTYLITPRPNQLSSLAAASPGDVWMIGNEPDRFRFQDDTHPEVYARIYYEAYHAIKQSDPTARIAPAGLVQVSPGRLQYLDIVFDTYRALYGHDMPVDLWTAHVYPLPEKNESDGSDASAGVALGTDTNLALLYPSGSASQVQSKCQDPTDGYLCLREHDDPAVIQNQVVAMRTWMKEHGYQNTPLILTEIGSLFPDYISDEDGVSFSRSRSAQHLLNITQYLETATDSNLGYPADNNKLVQQWAWFSMHLGGDWQYSNLLVNNFWNLHPTLGDVNALSVVGQNFRSEATNQALENNLFIEEAYGESGSGTLKLSAKIRNNGNTSIFSTVTVTFYSDAARTNEIGSATIDPVFHGCATNVHTASVDWTPSSSGVTQFWVTVDSDGTIPESNEGDNDGTATIFANPASSIWLPTMNRKP